MSPESPASDPPSSRSVATDAPAHAGSAWPPLLRRALDGGRIHSAYLLSGAGAAPYDAALAFARGLVCQTEPASARPCGDCRDCRRAVDDDHPIALDGTGKAGPYFRHVGDHPGLYWIDRAASTRVRIDQVRALRKALRLGSFEGGWRVAIIADAEWLSRESQNALLHLLEEPPERTCLLLVTTSVTALVPTIRSRCQRVRLPHEPSLVLRGEGASEECRELGARLDQIAEASLTDVLDWSTDYRGPRADAALRVEELLAVAGQWVREQVTARVKTVPSEAGVEGLLEAFSGLGRCRRDLAQRNANPQMVAERALLSVRRAFQP
ncbi:MAG: hypothetical protein VCC68_09015 [Myxococcota bacterium]|jgi:hypothetical protein